MGLFKEKGGFEEELKHHNTWYLSYWAHFNWMCDIIQLSAFSNVNVDTYSMLSAATSVFRQKRSVGISEICKFAVKSIAFKDNMKITSWESFGWNSKFFFWKEMFRNFLFFYKNSFLGISMTLRPLITAFWDMLHLSFWFQCNEWPQKCRFRHQHFVFSNKENIWQKNIIFVAAIFIFYEWWKNAF